MPSHKTPCRGMQVCVCVWVWVVIHCQWVGGWQFSTCGCCYYLYCFCWRVWVWDGGLCTQQTKCKDQYSAHSPLLRLSLPPIVYHSPTSYHRVPLEKQQQLVGPAWGSGAHHGALWCACCIFLCSCRLCKTQGGAAVAHSAAHVDGGSVL